ncbi:MAG: divisome protein SepX/GlpR [Nocardioidaceae bacterium]
MGLSGFLYGAIVVGWAVYLVPLALRRYDEATRNRSIERFSSTMSVLGGRDGTLGAGDTITTVKPSAIRRPTPDRPARWAAARRAARVAAKRRRRVLQTLALATAGTAVAAGLALISWWWVALPAAVVVVWLAACRTQVRRENEAFWTDAGADHDGRRTQLLHRRSRLDPVPAGANPARASAYAEDDEPTVVLDEQATAQVAVPLQTSDGGTLWDPVPVTLPTYVSKPWAARSTRPLERDEPGTGTPGWTEEAMDAELAGQTASAAESGQSEPAGTSRRAVGE